MAVNVVARVSLVLGAAVVFCSATPRSTWVENFDASGAPDARTWRYELGQIRNEELQYYTNRRVNARVEHGRLVIETRKEAFDGAGYTSASLTTQGRLSFLYGRIEVRARIPAALGTWPAIWMMGSDRSTVGWPRCGEIDIMEHVGFRPDTIWGTVHRPGRDLGGTVQVRNLAAGFHIYGIDWNRHRIVFSVDGRRYFTYPIRDGTADAQIFRKPFYLILNDAYGGTWGGAHGVDDRALPAYFLIDWIRVYGGSSVDPNFGR